MASVPKRLLTPQEYLAFDRASERHYEYFNGEMFVVAGTTREHCLICTNLISHIHRQFTGRPCEVYNAAMRIKHDVPGPYTYPDIVTSCYDRQFEDNEFDTLLNPQVLFEVLSKSTESYDRGLKFQNYKKIQSLTDYVLVSQYQVLVEQFTRQADGRWLLWSSEELTDSLVLPSIDITLKISDIYDRVEFQEPESRPQGFKVIEAKASPWHPRLPNEPVRQPIG